MKLPKFYYYKSNTLEFKRVRTTYIFTLIGLCILFFMSLTPLVVREYVNSDFYEPNTLVVNVNDTSKTFSEEKLITLLKDLNVKFPHIVLSQAKLESGNYTSKIFKENHNLFGMKEARVRINTANGTQYSHAYYDNWRESVYDYAFYQCRYLGRINTEQEYFNYLDQSYAEAPNYVETLKGMIERENLKELFEN